MIKINNFSKKLRLFLPVLAIAALLGVSAAPSAKVAQANTLNIDVEQIVTGVECKIIDGVTHNIIAGEVTVRNRSGAGIPVNLTGIRDWLFPSGSLTQGLMGLYALSVTDGQGFSWNGSYEMVATDLSVDNPPLTPFVYGPIADDQIVCLQFILDYQGCMPDEIRNMVEFTIACATDPMVCGDLPFSDRSDKFCLATVCEIINNVTPTPVPVVSPSESPTPAPTEMPTEMPEVEEEVILPVTGANGLTFWLYDLGILK